MEKRANAKIEEFLHDLKAAICDKIVGSTEATTTAAATTQDLVAFVNQYPLLSLRKEDLAKPKKRETTLLEQDRCSAKRASGEQCTRRRKDESDFCGTHCKGVPHGQVPAPDSTTVHQIQLYTEKIGGIVYFIDHGGHVYKTEDVLENKQNPEVVATWVRDASGRCVIPEFGLM